MTRAWWMAVAILALHLVGFGIYYGAGDYTAIAVGSGLLAYSLGLRHAFDADHIAAIDNTTRKLLADDPRSRPYSVGFWFALGHSTVVVVMVFAVGFWLKALAGGIQDEGSKLHEITGVWGPSVSGAFLWLLGTMNLFALLGFIRVARRAKMSHAEDTSLDLKMRGGPLYKAISTLTRFVRKPWHIYPIGLLFGLGFDTATEVSLIVLAGGAAAMSVPWWAVLSLPLIFTAGMVLMDSLNGTFMSSAYRWAFDKPMHKITYNIVMTSLSIVLALVIGSTQLASAIAPDSWLANIPAGYVGYGAVVVLLVLSAVMVGLHKRTHRSAMQAREAVAVDR